MQAEHVSFGVDREDDESVLTDAHLLALDLTTCLDNSAALDRAVSAIVSRSGCCWRPRLILAS